jgi:hypothetical protein
MKYVRSRIHFQGRRNRGGARGTCIFYDCNYFSFPPPRCQHFRGEIFRYPFHSKSAPRNRLPPPESFDASYAPVNFNHIRHQAWTSLCHKGCFTYNSSNPNRDCKPFLINCGVSISLEEIGGYPNFKGGGLRNT